VNFVFSCSKCGASQDVDSPLTTEIPCACGGMLVMSSTARKSKVLSQDSGFVQCVASGTVGEILLDRAPWMTTAFKRLKRYKVVQCRSCGEVQVSEAESAMKCRRCGKQAPFRLRGDWHVNLRDTNDYGEALRICKDWSANVKIKHDRSL
jgi:ribosomal protein S27E